MRQACDQAAANRIDPDCKDDGDDNRRLSYDGDGASHCNNDVDLPTDKLGCDLGVALRAALRPAILDRDVLTLDPAKFAKTRHKRSSPWSKGRSIRAQEPDGRQLARLLRARAARPRGDGAQQGDELAPSHMPLTGRGLHPISEARIVHHCN